MEDLHYSEDRNNRVKDTGEVFTPDSLVQKMLDSLNTDWDNPDQNETYCDPTCGSGQFLVVIARRGIPLHNIYGVDLMEDNIKTTKRRLKEIFLEKGMLEKDIDFHLDRNIICADALTYHFEFWQHEEEDKCINDDDW